MDPTKSLAIQALRPNARQLAKVPGLVILWSVDEPHRMGEVAIVPTGPCTLGRHEPAPGDAVTRLVFCRQRPGRSDVTGPLQSPLVSREQLAVERLPDGSLSVRNTGRAALLVDGERTDEAIVSAGGLLEIEGRLLLGVFARPATLPAPAPGTTLDAHPFGLADGEGIIGESPDAWILRERVAFVAPRHAHVLVRGESGTGKELVARALHDRSERRAKQLISRNAATIPEGLVDAELFGHVKNYPNPGVPERRGLVGEADGGTLFLDEFGELPEAVQGHLLRVLDDGEYTRLGEARPSRADLRLIAATNRGDEAFKHDVLARFKLRIDVPDLNGRREDVPLLVRGLLGHIAREDATIAARFFPDGDPAQPARVSCGLMRQLVAHTYTTHVRELEALLWQSLQKSRGDTLEPIEIVASRLRPVAGSTGQEAQRVDPNTLDAATIQACLDRHDGRQEPVWRELGLTSRHVLTRLVKKYGLEVKGRGSG
jgi:DNA-binding NtrC family response regulator